MALSQFILSVKHPLQYYSSYLGVQHSTWDTVNSLNSVEIRTDCSSDHDKWAMKCSPNIPPTSLFLALNSSLDFPGLGSFSYPTNNRVISCFFSSTIIFQTITFSQSNPLSEMDCCECTQESRWFHVGFSGSSLLSRSKRSVVIAICAGNVRVSWGWGSGSWEGGPRVCGTQSLTHISFNPSQLFSQRLWLVTLAGWLCQLALTWMETYRGLWTCFECLSHFIMDITSVWTISIVWGV